MLNAHFLDSTGWMKLWFYKLGMLLLVFSAGLTSPAAFAQSSETIPSITPFIAPNTPEFYERFSSPFLGVLAQLRKNEQEIIVSDALALYSAAIDYRHQLIEQYGEKRLIEILESAELGADKKPLIQEIKLEGFGKSELYLADGAVIVRVTHQSSQTAIIFVDDPRVQKDSAHLSKIVSRQLMTANRPQPGVHLGYDVVIARITPDCLGGNCEMEGVARPRGIKTRAWHYINALDWRLTKKGKGLSLIPTIATQKNMLAGTITGVYQAGVLLSIDALAEQLSGTSDGPTERAFERQFSDPNLVENLLSRRIDITPDSALFTFGFSVFSSAIQRGFVNWNELGARDLYNADHHYFELPKNKLDLVRPSQWQSRGHVWQLVKDHATKPIRRATLSLAYRMALALRGVDGRYFVMSLESTMGMVNLLANIAVSSANSNWWLQPVRTDRDMRGNTKPLFRPSESATREESADMYQMARAEENLRYNMIWTLSILDVLGVVTYDLPVLGTNILLPVSLFKVAMLASAAIGRWRAVRHAEKVGYSSAEEMRREFESTFYMRMIRRIEGLPGVNQIVKITRQSLVPRVKSHVVRPIQRASLRIKRSCSELLNLNYDF